MADSNLQEIKDRLNVADVIAGYIPIKKSGVNFKALCPFHNDKHPSLMISPQKQIWHCFVCGEGGDVFGFVMKYENLEFKDVLKILADKAGVKLQNYAPAKKEDLDEKELLLRINDFAARYYNKMLLEDKRGKAALEYLKNRGLNEQTINRWQIGYAPDDFHALERALAQKNVSPNELIKAGVSAKNERGQMYDRFRNRITFPIFNYFGDIVGFSARILNDDGQSAKYVNSPETFVYTKSKILFGLNFAKEAIRKNDEAVIVEGQMDCIQAHQAGFSNVVATSGTALTEEALALLGRLTKNLKFCFDADTAGQAAARRAGELALRSGFRLKVIILKNVKDPDELIKKSPGLWEKAVAEAVWFLDYYIDYAEANFAPNSVEQTLYISQEVVPFITLIQDSLEQDHYINKILKKFSISERAVRDKLKNTHIAQAKGPNSQPIVAAGAFPRSLLVQKEVLGGLLFYGHLLKTAQDQIDPDDFEDWSIKQVVSAYVDTNGQDPSVKQTTLAKEAQFMVESLLEELSGNEIAFSRELLKAFALLKVNAIKKRQQQLEGEIKAAELAKNKEKLMELNLKFTQASAERQKFETLF